MEKQIEELSKNVLAMQQMWLKQQQPAPGGEKLNKKGKTSIVPKRRPEIPLVGVESETTIYKNALEQVNLDKFRKKDRERSEGYNRFSS